MPTISPLFERKISVAFGDTDPQGFIYFARVFELAHQVLEDYLRNTALGWDFWFQNPEFAVPVRNANADFVGPMKVGQSYSALLGVKEIRNSSVTFTIEFVDSSGVKFATCSTTHTFVDKVSFRKISVPERVLDVLAAR